MAKENHGTCPACGADLNGGSIFDFFFGQTGSREEAVRLALMHGATEFNGQWGRQIAIYSRYQDRTVAYRCPDCEHEWPIATKGTAV